MVLAFRVIRPMGCTGHDLRGVEEVDPLERLLRSVGEDGGAPGGHHPLRNPFVVEVHDLLTQMVVLEQDRAARSGRQGVVGVVRPRPLCGRQVRAALRHARLVRPGGLAGSDSRSPVRSGPASGAAAAPAAWARPRSETPAPASPAGRRPAVPGSRRSAWWSSTLLLGLAEPGCSPPAALAASARRAYPVLRDGPSRNTRMHRGRPRRGRPSRTSERSAPRRVSRGAGPNRKGSPGSEADVQSTG